MVPHGTTKLTVKNHPVATSESLLAPTCTVIKIVLVVVHCVCAGNPASLNSADPVDQEATRLGANKMPFRTVELITSPLAGIWR
ncbi:MAG: hypothetical protein WCG98_03230 [bacterium]